MPVYPWLNESKMKWNKSYISWHIWLDNLMVKETIGFNLGTSGVTNNQKGIAKFRTKEALHREWIS